MNISIGRVSSQDLKEVIGRTIPIEKKFRIAQSTPLEIQNFTHPIMTEPPELLGFLSVNFPHSYSLSKSVIPLMHMFNV
ncbi:MAG: hypothetical protein QXO62_07110, partial [Thermoproteota archaeon]